MTTAPDGNYAIRGLGDGTYLLTVSAPGYAGCSQQITLSGGTVTPVEIQLQPLPGHLTGTIADTASGGPIAVATVMLGEWSTQTDASGRYARDRLTPGAYALQVSIEGYEPHQADVTIAPGTSRTIDVPLTPSFGALLAVKVVDGASGSPIAGATVSYGTTGSPSVAWPTDAGTADDQPCPDVKLLVPLKRSPQFAAIRRRVADPHHSDAWVEDGLHFFVYQLHPAEGAGTGPPGANGGAPGPSAAQAPVAVFAMHPESSTVHSAVVVTPGPGGA